MNTDCIVIVEGEWVDEYNIVEVRDVFTRYGKLVSIRNVHHFDPTTCKKLERQIEITFDSVDAAENARVALDLGNIVIDNVVYCSPETYDEPCGCSYGSRHGDRSYRSCQGDRCRNEAHKHGCCYETCTACHGSDSESV